MIGCFKDAESVTHEFLLVIERALLVGRREKIKNSNILIEKMNVYNFKYTQ